MIESIDEFSEAELEKQVQTLIVWARKNLNFEQAIRAFAMHKAVADVLLNDADESSKSHHETLTLLAKSNLNHSDTLASLIDACKASMELSNFIPKAIKIGMISEKRKASKRGKAAADALHERPGGSRSKADEIRKIWASGKYTARSRCAEEECASLGMSYDTARKALRNTPKP